MDGTTVSDGAALGLFGSEEPSSISAKVIVAKHLPGSVSRSGAVFGWHLAIAGKVIPLHLVLDHPPEGTICAT